MKKAKIFLWLIVFGAGSLLSLSSCENKSQKNKTPIANNKNQKPTEEEIKYFFPTGHYDLDIEQLGYQEETEGYNYIFTDDLENKNIIDPKGNLLSLVDIKNLFQISTIEGEFAEEYEGELFYKTKIDPYKYYIIEEVYNLGFAETKFFCKNQKPEALPKDLILDDNFIVRLYNKNNKVLDQHKMRNDSHFESYKEKPELYQKKITYEGVGIAHLIGMLKLPPKNKREGLKYRVLRLDKNGKAKPYLYPEAYKYPLQYYLWEESLPPYSEYKNWDYDKESGCYYHAHEHIKVGAPRE